MDWQHRFALRATNRRLPDFWFGGALIVWIGALLFLNWHVKDVPVAATVGFLLGTTLTGIQLRALRDIIDGQRSSREIANSDQIPTSRPLDRWRQAGLLIALGVAGLIQAYGLIRMHAIQ